MKALAEIVIKALAAYLVFSGVGDFLPLLATRGEWLDDGGAQRIYVTLALVTPILMGLLLWVLAPALAARAMPATAREPDMETSALVSAGVFLIGVYWLVRSISMLLTQWGAAGVPVNYGWCLVGLLSLVLILGSRCVAVLFHKLRTAGTNAG